MDPAHLSRMAGTADYLFPIPDQWLSAFPEERFDRSFDEGDSDYLYLTERIATFAGNCDTPQLHGQAVHIHGCANGALPERRLFILLSPAKYHPDQHR